MKIYTKTGDKGQTSLIGGTRVPKYDERIEAYGSIDELNSFIGLVKDQNIDDYTKNILLDVQNKLFIIESLLATDIKNYEKNYKISLPSLYENDINFLEEQIDKMNEDLPKLNNFILPSGHPIASMCHICRTICRRCERITIKVIDNNPDILMSDLIIKYLNRLSDFLFVLSRKILKDNNSTEVLWKIKN